MAADLESPRYRQQTVPRQAPARQNRVAASLGWRWRRPRAKRRRMVARRPAVVILRNDGARRHRDRLVIGQRMGGGDTDRGPERRSDFRPDQGAEPRIDPDRSAEAGAEGGADGSTFNGPLGRLLRVDPGELVGKVAIRIGAVEEGEFGSGNTAG